MERNQLSTQTLHTPHCEEPEGPSRCPLCGGSLVPLRGLLRCSLCCFVLCESCEGGLGESWPSP